MRVPLFHIDAFTDQPFAGNPAAVCLLNSWLDDALLLKVAAENNLSATAFLVPGGTGEATAYEMRWFTPRCEVRLCGHATLASAYVVLKLLSAGLGTVQFQTRFGGMLVVREEGDSLAMDFPALYPQLCKDTPASLAQALRARPSEVLEVNDIYVCVFEDEDAIIGIRPDSTLLEQLHPFAVSITAPGKEADFVSRYFAPSYGIAEDPVTGSAHCVLAPYWAKRLGKTHLHARQLSERGGQLSCKLAGQRVLLKGKVVLVLQGSLMI
jgi:PhzF family phenazine biosynthesis protein